MSSHHLPAVSSASWGDHRKQSMLLKGLGALLVLLTLACNFPGFPEVAPPAVHGGDGNARDSRH